MNKYLYNHTSPETAYLVKDYPYGFRLRTQIRYWIETTKNGDRFVSQTLNPKTNAWNKEKKSTYIEISVMFLDEKNYVKCASFSHWDDEDKLNQWLTDKDQTKFNALQLDQIKKLRAIFRTRKHVTVSMVNVTNWTDEQRNAFNEKQEKAKAAINKLAAMEYMRQ